MKSSEFKSIVMPLSSRLYRLAFRLLNSREEAEDAVQEVFLKLWGMRNQLGAYRSVEALAVSITRNRCIDVLRKRKRELEGKAEAGVPDRNEKDALEEMIRSEEQEGLLKLIDALPEPQRTLVQLRHMEGYPYEDIAKMMDMNVNAIRVSISRARAQLKEMVVNQYIPWKA
ncbi:MAG: RNA polymerase sigma factor [Bacteroidota bacterium]